MKRLLFLFIVTLSALTMPLLSAEAETFTVTKTADTADGTCDADCSLREAVIAANANAGEDIIQIGVGTFTITRAGDDDTASLGDLDVTQSTTIQGMGADVTVVDGGQLDRVFQFNPSSSSGVAIFLTNMTIQNGKVAGSMGGGIWSDSYLAIQRCRITNNQADISGGGINFSGSLGIQDSVFDNNESLTGSGGAIATSGLGGPLAIVNSTISGNKAALNGGGLISNSSVRLANVTITDNIADSDANGSGDGGGFFAMSGDNAIKNTVLSGNNDLSPSGNIHPDCSVGAGGVSPNSTGYNLIGINEGCNDRAATFSSAHNDIVGTSTSPLSAGLTLLALKGGKTPTHSFLTGSPAFNAGNPAGCTDYSSTPITTDQRGFPRPVGARCDIGAFEQGDCGDGVKDPGEACDDGNTTDTDACSSTCELADCGDGFVQAGVEECDDGNTNDGDGCAADCTEEPSSTTGGGTTGGETGGETTGGDSTGGGTVSGTTAGTGTEENSGGCSLVRGR